MTESLVEMAAGREGEVLSIEGGHGVTARLDAMGIRPGVTLVKVTGPHLHGPVTVRVGSARVAIGFGMALKVFVAAEGGRTGADERERAP